MTKIEYLPEAPAHDAEIEAINEEAFGPGRFARAAYKIREQGGHDPLLSFVAMQAGVVIGSVRMTPGKAGEGRALLLAPLAGRSDHKNQGIGRHLVGLALEKARAKGFGAVILVGDAPYYGPFGFVRLPYGQISLPRPADPNRLLAAELSEGAVAKLQGELMHAWR